MHQLLYLPAIFKCNKLKFYQDQCTYIPLPPEVLDFAIQRKITDSKVNQ